MVVRRVCGWDSVMGAMMAVLKALCWVALLGIESAWSMAASLEYKMGAS